MRVLMVSNLFPPVVVGGAETYAGWLTDHLVDAGHEVGVVTLGVQAERLVAQVRPWPHRPDVARAQPAPKRAVFHALDVWRPDTTRVIRRAVADFRPDVVHTHTVQGMSTSALVAPRTAPHVHTLHDYWLLCWRSTLLRRHGGPCGPACRLLRRGRGVVVRRNPPDVVLSPSQAVFDEHTRGGIAFTGVDTEVLPHPVEGERPRPPRPSDRPPTLGFLGQVSPNKGIGTMLDAFARLGIDGARLLVAGRGRVASLVEDREQDGIRYLGWVGPAEKEEFFDQIDALVVPSEWPEPAGLVINEAKARGVPVIGARSGGIPEYVPVRSRELLVPPFSPDALAESMRRVLADPERFAPVPEDLAVTWDVHTASVVAAYERAIAQRSHRAGTDR